jgi:hypothetical protein
MCNDLVERERARDKAPMRLNGAKFDHRSPANGVFHTREAKAHIHVDIMGGIFCNVEEIKIKALERYYYVRKK